MQCTNVHFAIIITFAHNRKKKLVQSQQVELVRALFGDYSVIFLPKIRFTTAEKVENLCIKTNIDGTWFDIIEHHNIFLIFLTDR